MAKVAEAQSGALLLGLCVSLAESVPRASDASSSKSLEDQIESDIYCPRIFARHILNSQEVNAAISFYPPVEEQLSPKAFGY